MIDKEKVEQVLRQAGREAMGLQEGKYFDQRVFLKQADAIMELFADVLDSAWKYEDMYDS